MTPGTLVRVRVERVDPKSEDSHIIAEHGVLWFYVRSPNRDRYADSDLHKFRALATNYEHLWFDHEVETTQQGDTDAEAQEGYLGASQDQGGDR